jgi:type IV pilus assembly protein PilY1
MESTMRTVIGSLVIALLASTSARAGNANSCWDRDLERMDYYSNPPEHGDNNFFTTVVAQTGNVSLLYPAKQSLREFPQRLYRMRVDLGGATPTGCTNAYLNGRTYFMPTSVLPPAGAASLQGVYNPAITYPDPDTTYSGGGGSSAGFVATSAYQYQQWPANDTGIAQTPTNACSNALNVYGQKNSGNLSACVSCLNTQGYWLNPYAPDNDVGPEAAVFMGNRLNFSPPKWELLHLAYKRLVNGPLLSSLREAVVAMNGATGGTVVQKMLPQSCQGSGRPLNQKLGAIDGLTYTSTANPLAEMMFNTAWYMGGQQSSWAFAEAAMGGGNIGKSGPCNGCNADFEVIFSDGRGDAANPSCISGAVAPNLFCTATASNCSTPAVAGLGSEQDGDDFLDPNKYSDVAAAITGASVRQTPGGTCDMDFADDVALWMSTHDNAVGQVGTKIKSYVVAVGDPNNTYGEMSTLKAVAANGGGLYVVADDYQTLEANIDQVFLDIIRRATSFSVAAISTVQTRGSTFAFIPRFRPLEGAQWEGRLLRFNLFNEFTCGCTSADYGHVTTCNPNGNSSCNDVYLTDKNGKFIGEDSDGGFAVLDTSQPYDGGWPLLTTALADGGQAETPAVPLWEAASLLNDRENAILAGTSSDTRTIFTVAPNGGAWGTTAVPVTVANVSNITPLMQLGGYNGDFCTELAGVTRHTYTQDDDCTTDVIKFLHGQDVMLQNPLNRTQPPPNPMFARPNILGDIFHSSPVLVSPPIETFLCDYGVSNQCLATLYNSQTPNSSQAYQLYQAGSVSNRDEFILVAANDGMVHAFHGGAVTGADQLGQPIYDSGTGRELWAFIPPDMMPKIARYLLNTRHEILVDGTPMVRDIWVDGSGTSAPTPDGQKQADEFHTIAVFGEREGGRHYFALDVSSPTSPKFLWSFPPPGTGQSLEMGESWDDVAPAPPAIGPVAVYDTGGAFTVNGKQASERWIFAFGGGFDPSYARGRGIYVIDTWTGQPLFQYRQSDASGGGDLRQQLWPVAAPVSLVDTDGDGLFDTLVAPDTGGQVWMVSMMDPGGVTTDANGLFTNWYATRVFIESKGSPLYKRHPFGQRAGVAKITNPSSSGLSGTQGPIFRVLLGSGDRDQIKDGNGGTCGIANLGACLRKNCTVDVKQNVYRVGQAPQGASGGHFYDGEWQDTASNTSTNPQTLQIDNLSQQSNCSDVADVNIQYNITCGGTTTTYNDQVYCDWGAGTDGGTECPVNAGRPMGTSIPYTASVTMEPSKFYSFTLFDMSSGTGTPTGKRLPVTDQATATNWDQNLILTETNLVDVTSQPAGVASCISSGTCPSSATTGKNNVLGWMVQHVNSVSGQPSLPGDEKTSAGALVLGGCALWQTLLPNTAQQVSCGGTLPPDNGYAYQGDIASGSVACGSSSGTAYTGVRYVRTDTIVAPQEATPVVAVNPSTQQTMISGISLPVGAQPLQLSIGVGLPRGDVHWLELSPQQHNCRHNGAGCTQ